MSQTFDGYEEDWESYYSVENTHLSSQKMRVTQKIRTKRQRAKLRDTENHYKGEELSTNQRHSSMHLAGSENFYGQWLPCAPCLPPLLWTGMSNCSSSMFQLCTLRYGEHRTCLLTAQSCRWRRALLKSCSWRSAIGVPSKPGLI